MIVVVTTGLPVVEVTAELAVEVTISEIVTIVVEVELVPVAVTAESVTIVVTAGPMAVVDMAGVAAVLKLDEVVVASGRTVTSVFPSSVVWVEEDCVSFNSFVVLVGCLSVVDLSDEMLVDWFVTGGWDGSNVNVVFSSGVVVDVIVVEVVSFRIPVGGLTDETVSCLLEVTFGRFPLNVSFDLTVAVVTFSESMVVVDVVAAVVGNVRLVVDIVIGVFGVVIGVDGDVVFSCTDVFGVENERKLLVAVGVVIATVETLNDVAVFS